MKFRKAVIVAVLAALAVVAWLSYAPESASPVASPELGAGEKAGAAPPDAPALPKTAEPAKVVEPKAVAEPTKHAETPRGPLPTKPLHAGRKTWVRGSYGPNANQFGQYKTEGEVYPPQGFVVTPDGKLVVLDTGKKRLLWYGADGKIEREVALPADSTKVPADVAVAKDGTIVVMDHLKGIVLLDPTGKKKAEMPKPNEEGVTGMYAVGNEIMATVDGMTTVKAGDTSGVPDSETRGVHFQEEDGRIPGHVAPDGKTVLRVGFDDPTDGDFWVSSMRGSPGQEVFTRFFHAPGVTSIPLIQADDAGHVYLVVNTTTTFSMICLDGNTGEPVGMVDMPPADGTGGKQFRMFNVVPTGGVMYEEASPAGVRFEWFNCF